MSLASRRLVAASFALLVAFAAVGTRPAPAAAADLTISDAEHEMVRLINVERAKAGLVRVRRDSRLFEIAGARSADMAAKGYFSHVQPDGRNVFDLISSSGITWYGAGEIIAWNNWPTLGASAVVARDGWLNSPTHRSIMLSNDYNYVGIGLAVDGRGNKLWTGVFMKGPDRTGGWVRFSSLPRYSAAMTGARAVTVSWSGGDRPLQVLTSGFRHFQTQARTDGGVWKWTSYGTTSTSRTMTVYAGHGYDVRVRACDRAANCGRWNYVHVTG